MTPSAVYTLTPPAGSPVVFNDGELKTLDDLYWLADVTGLDTADIRAPQFRKPLAHGGYAPVPFLEDPLHPRFEGAFLVQSAPIGSSQCDEIRTAMYNALKACLRACLPSDGTLSWTEPGVGALSLPVRYEQRIAHGYEAGYALMTFTFGLFSEASQPA